MCRTYSWPQLRAATLPLEADAAAAGGGEAGMPDPSPHRVSSPDLLRYHRGEGRHELRWKEGGGEAAPGGSEGEKKEERGYQTLTPVCVRVHYLVEMGLWASAFSRCGPYKLLPPEIDLRRRTS